MENNNETPRREDDGKVEFSYYDNDLGEMSFRVSREKYSLFGILQAIGVVSVIVGGLLLGFCESDLMMMIGMGLAIFGGVMILILAPLLADWLAD